MHKNKSQKARARARRQGARNQRAMTKKIKTTQTIQVWGPKFWTHANKLEGLGFVEIKIEKAGLKNPSSLCDAEASLITYAVPKTAKVQNGEMEDSYFVTIGRFQQIDLSNGIRVRIEDNGTNWSQVSIRIPTPRLNS